MKTRILLKPYSVNGTGIRLIDYLRVSSDTYEATRWLSFFFIPLIPIGTWLVRPGTAEGNGMSTTFNFQILGTKPLKWKRVFRMWMYNVIAAIPITLCSIFETPGENTNMWITLVVLSVIWAFAALIYAQRGANTLYEAPVAQPLPTGGAGPRRAA
ncbi:MAG: hypothetical protein ACJ796_22570 [Gemmatimonadaceae bacterium]